MRTCEDMLSVRVIRRWKLLWECWF